MKGILFTEENYVLSVHNHKTATRRGPAALTKIVNENPNDWHRPQIETLPSNFDGVKDLKIDGTYAVFKKVSHNQGDLPECIKFRFEIGEIAYVQEPVHVIKPNEFDLLSLKSFNLTKNPKNSNELINFLYRYMNEFLPERSNENKFWQNKMFMNPAFARYYVKFTDINIERLFDITDNDCFREGIMRCSRGYGMFDAGLKEIKWMANLPHLVYHKIWNDINGKGSAGKNPYVFCYDYVLHDNLAELQSLDVELFKAFPYFFSESETNHITLSYDCACGLDETWFNFGKTHPRWKDLAEHLVEYAINRKINVPFIIEHSLFAYGRANKNQRRPLPDPVKEYAYTYRDKKVNNK